MLSVLQSYAAPRKAHYSAFLMGVVDGSGFLLYLTGLDVNIFYSILIVLKLVIVAYFRKEFRFRVIRPHLVFFVTAIFAELICTVVWGGGNLPKVIAFCVSLGISLPFVAPKYFGGIAAAGFLNSVIFLVFWQLGLIPESFGRLLYFGGEHPNLGSEIFYGSSIAAILYGSRRIVLLAAPLMTTPIVLMQGRAALVGCAILFGGYYLRRFSKMPKNFLALFLVLSAALIIVLSIWYSGALANAFNSLLLLDDPYRGTGTGGVGRNDRWLQALEVFSNSPLIGGGSDYPDRLSVLDAHNFVLWALASYGALGMILIFMLTHKMIFALRRSSVELKLVLISWLPLLIFNDRFMNLNLYPFIIYVVIFTFCTQKKTIHHQRPAMDALALSHKT